MSRRRFLVLGAAGLVATTAAPLLDTDGPAGAAGTVGLGSAATDARVVANPNLLWNGSFEFGTLSGASTTTAVWTITNTF